MIEPKVIDLTRHVDDRGDLAELWRFSWSLLMNFDLEQPVGLAQVYTVYDPAAFTVRAYHRHEYLWDLFHIATGSAKFHLALGPSRFPVPNVGIQNLRDAKAGDDLVVTLSARKPQLLVVPPLYWHGWMSLEPGTLLISMASHEYNREKPDEERIPYNSFGGHVWEVSYK